MSHVLYTHYLPAICPIVAAFLQMRSRGMWWQMQVYGVQKGWSQNGKTSSLIPKSGSLPIIVMPFCIGICSSWKIILPNSTLCESSVCACACIVYQPRHGRTEMSDCFSINLGFPSCTFPSVLLDGSRNTWRRNEKIMFPEKKKKGGISVPNVGLLSLCIEDYLDMFYQVHKISFSNHSKVFSKHAKSPNIPA